MGKSHIDGPASTGGRVESSPPSRRQTVTAPVPGVTGVGASTANRKKQRASQAALNTVYSGEEQQHS